MYLVVALLLWFFIAFIGVSYVALLIFGVSYFGLAGGSIRILSGEGYSVQEEFGFSSRVAKSE